MALINNSSELALECALDKLWIDYDWYYQWRHFFLYKKLSDKKTQFFTRYAKLSDINHDIYTHKIVYKIGDYKFDDKALYCFITSHCSNPDQLRFSILFTWKEIKNLIWKIKKVRQSAPNYISIYINRRPYLYLWNGEYLDITSYVCVKRLDRLKENFLK